MERKYGKETSHLKVLIAVDAISFPGRYMFQSLDNSG